MYPSLNTQFCIKGLLVVQDFCYWAVWAAGLVLKKKVWADFEQLLRSLLVYEIAYIKANYHRITNDDQTPFGNYVSLKPNQILPTLSFCHL
jgi:hypothetical protein